MPTLTLGQSFARLFWRIAPQRLYTRFIGWAAALKIPRWARKPVLGTFARIYGIDLSEAELEITAYATLQAFFTRRLKVGARPLSSSPSDVVAPSDGAICESGIAHSGTMLEAKGSSFTVHDLLAEPGREKELVGAPYVIIYLSPRDYHRVHSPVEGLIRGWTHIPGTLFPVGPASVKREAGLFAKNERFVIHIDTEAGRCYVVMVAAVGVGHVTCSFDANVGTHRPNFNPTGKPISVTLPTPVPIGKGSELAIFNLGSTTITIFEPNRVSLQSFQDTSHVKMGATIGRMMRG